MKSKHNLPIKVISIVVLCFFSWGVFDIACAEIYMSISGTVKDAVTGEGIVGVEVIAMQENLPPEKSHFATTDSNGNFIIRFVPPGMYDLYTYLSSEYVTTYSSMKITVVKGRNIERLNILLHKAGSVSGKVFQNDGITPVKGATVGAYTSNDNIVFGTTNDNGEYMISGLKETSSCTVVILPDGYAGIFKEDIPVTQQQITQGVNFILDPDLSTGINGTVRALNDSNIANALILFYGEKGGGKAVTDSSGRFSLLGLAPGNYTAKVIVPDYQVLE
jgi:hypothetical protein